MLARENKPDLVRPWAIIIAKDPSHPHFEEEYTPAVSKAICPTEE